MVSQSRYSIFRNAFHTSRGAYTLVNPGGEGLAKASMVHLSQDDKPEKVAWSVQPQLRHAIDHVSMVAQGVKKIDKVAKTPLCEHTSYESLFQFLKSNEVFDRKEYFCLKVDLDSDSAPSNHHIWMAHWVLEACLLLSISQWHVWVHQMSCHAEQQSITDL